jgi:hypothetical protein
MHQELLAKVPDRPRLGDAASAATLEGHKRSRFDLVEQPLAPSLSSSGLHTAIAPSRTW